MYSHKVDINIKFYERYDFKLIAVFNELFDTQSITTWCMRNDNKSYDTENWWHPFSILHMYESIILPSIFELSMSSCEAADKFWMGIPKLFTDNYWLKTLVIIIYYDIWLIKINK